ncbi:hypothetical protein ACEP5D_34040, partial [Pseudomonas aeruginosa]
AYSMNSGPVSFTRSNIIIIRNVIAKSIIIPLPPLSDAMTRLIRRNAMFVLLTPLTYMFIS